MDQPVNFSNLRAITGGDKEMEAELFKLFLESSDSCMAQLQAACAADDEGAWKREAHAFKGLCFNLGAELLGALCQKAQQDFGATAYEKSQMLAAMAGELNRVREAIKA